MCRFSRKTHLFRNVRNFLLLSFFQLLKIIFSDSASKTEYRQVIKSTIDSKLYWCWRFESRRVRPVQVDFLNLSNFSTLVIKANVLSHSTHHTTTYKVTERFFSLSFLCREKSLLLVPQQFQAVFHGFRIQISLLDTN